MSSEDLQHDVGDDDHGTTLLAEGEAGSSATPTEGHRPDTPEADKLDLRLLSLALMKLLYPKVSAANVSIFSQSQEFEFQFKFKFFSYFSIVKTYLPGENYCRADRGESYFN